MAASAWIIRQTTIASPYLHEASMRPFGHDEAAVGTAAAREQEVICTLSEATTLTFIVLVSVVASVIGLALVRRKMPTDRLESLTDVAGYIYAVIGVIYAVILAFVVIAAWEEYRDAAAEAATEASAVLNLARIANGWQRSGGKRELRGGVAATRESQ